jgi:ribonuclease PH
MPEASPLLFRPDSRSADALRTIRITPNFVATAEGSVLIESGNTRVLCNATVETGVPGWLRNSGRGWVTAEYGMLPRATLTRTPRGSADAPTRSSASSAAPSAPSST